MWYYVKNNTYRYFYIQYFKKSLKFKAHTIIIDDNIDGGVLAGVDVGVLGVWRAAPAAGHVASQVLIVRVKYGRPACRQNKRGSNEKY